MHCAKVDGLKAVFILRVFKLQAINTDEFTVVLSTFTKLGREKKRL